MTDPGGYVAGIHELPYREAPNRSSLQLHAEAAHRALADAGIPKTDVDAYFTAGVPEYSYGKPALMMADYMGLDLATTGTTDFGGSSYVNHVGHAVSAFGQNKCDVALVTWAGRPRSRRQATGTGVRKLSVPQDSFERIYGETTVANYALAAQRHMHEYGTTSEQLAEIRVAAGHHAQYNEYALYPDPVTVDEVVNSRPIADPLHLLDCCVITDGGGAFVLVSDSYRDRVDRKCVRILGHGESVGHPAAGRLDITTTAAADSGRRAFAEAGLTPADVDYASIYDSFTITVLETLEDLGFCPKGEGGRFVEGGTLLAPDGELPINTDGGGLASNHPGNRGGMTKILEAVRQLRGEANPPVQLDDPQVALVHGTGGRISTRHGCATVLLGRGDT